MEASRRMSHVAARLACVQLPGQTLLRLSSSERNTRLLENASCAMCVVDHALGLAVVDLMLM